MNSSDRFERIEAALLRLRETALRALSDRMVAFEGQMTEALGRLRIIGEQLASHTHEGGG